MRPKHHCVVCVFDDVIIAEPGTTVVGHQGVEEGAQDASLWGTCAQCDGAGPVMTSPHEMRSVRKFNIQFCRLVFNPRGPSLVIRC